MRKGSFSFFRYGKKVTYETVVDDKPAAGDKTVDILTKET